MISKNVLKKSGLKSIEMCAMGTMVPTLNVTYLDGTIECISIRRIEINNGVENIINNFINKSTLKNRKEKILKLNEI